VVYLFLLQKRGAIVDFLLHYMTRTAEPMNSNSSDNILNNLLDGVIIVNQEGKIIYANNAAQVLFEKSLADLLNQNLGFPVTPHEVEEIEIVRQGRIRVVQMLANTIQWNNQNAVLLSLRDITELKQISKELLTQ